MIAHYNYDITIHLWRYQWRIQGGRTTDKAAAHPRNFKMFLRNLLYKSYYKSNKFVPTVSQ